jgi:DNA-binding SARP family transcriptional activator
LWPEVNEDKARERLKVAVYFLRQQVRAAGMDGDFIESSGDGYVLRGEVVWVDADAFERLATVGIELERGQKWHEALRCYEDARVIYRGDYLEEDTYADWCAEERARLRELYFELIDRMTQIYITLGRHAEAAQACRTVLAREPCRESFHHTLMGCLAELGRPDQALAQFRLCQQVLARELGVEPMPETYRLHRQILEDRSDPRKFGPKRA